MTTMTMMTTMTTMVTIIVNDGDCSDGDDDEKE